MNDLQLFNFEGNEVRTLKIEDEPYFVGNDIAKILGYSNYRKAVVERVEDEDKLRAQIRYAGQKRNMTIINESGLYSLILSSKMPNACGKGIRYNQPTQKAMELGLFKVRERTINNPDGSTKITVTTKVTGKGQQYFINRFLSSEPNQLNLEIASKI